MSLPARDSVASWRNGDGVGKCPGEIAVAVSFARAVITKYHREVPFTAEMHCLTVPEARVWGHGVAGPGSFWWL